MDNKVLPTNILDKDLWLKAKKKADEVYDKPSAYKSGFIVKYYKDLGGKFKGKKPSKKGLSRWYKEEWVNQHGNVGYEHKDDVYRPSKKITLKTPKTWNELSKADIEKAKRKKTRKGRVNKF
jgi:hypothetical protein